MARTRNGGRRAPSPSSDTSEGASEARDDRGKDIASESDTESEQQVNSPMEDSDEDLGDREEEQFDLKKIPADEYARIRHRSQFLLPCNSTNPRFHTQFQEQVYEQLYKTRLFADHKFVDWDHLGSIAKYDGVYGMFRRAGLHHLVALRTDYNEDIIRQFYATVYISPNFQHIAWMTGNQPAEATRHDFELALRTESSDFERVYDRPALELSAISQYYDQGSRFIPGKLVGLSPLPSLINRIINHTILPKSGNYDAIRGHAWNLIEYVMEGRKFDVVDLIIREIAASKNDRIRRINYAPFIMALILRKTEYRGGMDTVHRAYKPRPDPPIPAAARSQSSRPAATSAAPAAPSSSAPAAPSSPAPAAQSADDEQFSLSRMYSAILQVRDSQIEGFASLSSQLASISSRLDSFDGRLSAIEQTVTHPPSPLHYSRRRRRVPSPSAPQE